jgi:hypothetical protein
MTCFALTALHLRSRAIGLATLALAAGLAIGSGAAIAAATNLPVTGQQRGTAQKVAEAGVALSDLASNAPDSYAVKRGDTLWGVSKVFLKQPWRWPELWGMNLDQIRNPHLIYPGQTLYLDTSSGRARLRVGKAVGSGGIVKLSPRVRSSSVETEAIGSIPFSLIEPFLNEAVIFDTNALDSAPRIVAAQEGRVLMTKGETAYVRGNDNKDKFFRIFRQPKALRDPETNEILGYEAPFVGNAELTQVGDTRVDARGKNEVVPDSILITSVRQEANVGDRLAPVGANDYDSYAPHAPAADLAGQIVSVYGDAVAAGQNQIVALNRGSKDGVERGHVLALWRKGSNAVDRTDDRLTRLRLPDERHGELFVFRVFERLSYALILTVQDPVRAGDRFTQP